MATGGDAQERFIVLAPTTQCYDGTDPGVAEGEQVGFFDLETNLVRTRDGTLQAKRSGAELLRTGAPP